MFAPSVEPNWPLIMPRTGRLSGREGAAMHCPEGTQPGLVPAAPRGSGGGQRLQHPVWEISKQGQKLTLLYAGNLKSENTEAYGAKRGVRISTVESPIGGLHSSPVSQQGQPQTRKPRGCWFSGGARGLTFHCLDQLEQPAQVHNDFMTFKMRWKNPAPLPIRHYKSLAHWDLNSCTMEMLLWGTLCPTPACQEQLATFRYYQKKNPQTTRLLSPCRDTPPTPWAAQISIPQAQANPLTLPLQHVHAPRASSCSNKLMYMVSCAYNPHVLVHC